MTGDLNLIQEIKKIDSVAIGLPNGTHTLAGQEGSVVLGERIKLNKVLYVPSFKCNLVSIAKLCKELNCSVTFYDDFCVLQDRTSRTPIGVGKQNRGVYFFTDGTVEERKVNAVSTVDLWHRRLGHPSCETLSHLSSSLQVNFNKKKVDVCETCYRAKQTRNCFPLSSSKAEKIFQLIYCDIWGLYRESSTNGAHYFLASVDDASRATWVYLRVDKGETSYFLREFIIMVKNQFDTSVNGAK